MLLMYRTKIYCTHQDRGTFERNAPMFYPLIPTLKPKEYLLGFRGEMVTNQRGEDKWHGPSWSFPFTDQYMAEGSSKRESAVQLWGHILGGQREESVNAPEKISSVASHERVKSFIPHPCEAICLRAIPEPTSKDLTIDSVGQLTIE